MTIEAHHETFGVEHQSSSETTRRRLLDQEPLGPEELELAVEYYRQVYEQRTNGPQLEGLPAASVETALADPRTVAIECSTPNGHVVWPLLAPVEHNPEYRSEFFDDHIGSDAKKRTFFYSDPGEELLPSEEEGKGPIVGLRELAERKAVVVCDYQEAADDKTRQHFLQLAASEKVRLNEPLAELDERDQPRVLHFSGLASPIERTGSPETDLHEVFQARVARGEAEARPFNGPAILDPHDIATNQDGLADQLWQAYDAQFDDLVDDHPSMQKQSRDQLMTMLSDPETVTTAYFKQGKVVGFSFFVRNVKTCEWLDPGFYEEKFPDEELAVFPGIVVEKSEEGQGYSLPMIRTFSDTAAEANMSARIAFQCTNVSAQYVPRIVSLGINRTDSLQFTELEQTASYKYDVFQLEAASTALQTTPGTELIAA